MVTAAPLVEVTTDLILRTSAAIAALHELAQLCRADERLSVLLARYEAAADVIASDVLTAVSANFDMWCENPNQAQVLNGISAMHRQAVEGLAA